MDFQRFWDSELTIPGDKGFSYFAAGHILWLVSAIIACIAGVLVYRRLSVPGRRKFFMVFALSLATIELIRQIAFIAVGRWSVAFLPLHICSIHIFVCLAQAFRPGKMKEEILYCLCLPGSLIALLVPGWSVLPLDNFFCIQSFIVHTMLLMAPLLLLVGGFRPNYKMLGKCLVPFLVVCPFLYVFNKIFATNFAFLNFPGCGNPLSWFASLWGNPGYLFGIPILLAGVWAILYLPYTLFQRYGRKKEAI